MIINLMTDILALAKEISENTEADVFVYYSPHVAWLEVQIYTYGWENGKRFDEAYTVKLDDKATEDNLKVVYNRLLKLKGEMM